MSYRLRSILLAMFLIAVIFGGAYLKMHARLRRQIERTSTNWPVGEAAHADQTYELPARASPLSLAIGFGVMLAFFAGWYWMLRKAQSLHPRTRGYPSYDATKGGSQL